MKLVWLVHAAATWALVGLIWLIQLVHYPGFGRVGADAFAGYEAFHTRAITPLVGVLMLAEGLTALLLLGAAFTATERLALGIGLGLIALVWLHTALIAVPLHGRLASGADAEAIGRLVATNWVRTLAWTARGLLVGWLIWRRWG